MNRIIVRIALPILAGFMLMVGSGGVALAACPGSGTAKGQVLQGVGQTGGNCDASGVNSTITNVVRILSFFVGVAAIIMIVVSGLRYITSAGDAGKVGAAKNTLIYAVIGLVVAALAQLLVKIVVTQASK